MIPTRVPVWPAVVAALFVPPSLAAQAATDAGPAEVMILRTDHLANPGLDVVQFEVADVLTPGKQAEIAEVVDAIARFRPTLIAVEERPASAARLDSLYTAYRAGRHELSRNETQQVGFRLAARFDHPRLHPIDHPGEFPFGAVMEYAQCHDPEFVALVQEEIAQITAEANREQREYTVGGILRRHNDLDRLARGHASYLRFARVGAGDSYVGADLLAKWYDRNIRIFANLQRVTGPGDRVVVGVGSGHAPILRELTRADPDKVLVEAVGYLPGAR